MTYNTRRKITHQHGEAHAGMLTEKEAGRYLEVTEVTREMQVWDGDDKLTVDVHVDVDWVTGSRRVEESC